MDRPRRIAGQLGLETKIRWPCASDLIVEAGRLIRFGMVGMLAGSVYALVTFVTVATGLGNPIAATVIGHFAAGVISYFGHLKFSFAVVPDHQNFMWRFLIIAAATFAANIGVTWLFTNILSISYLLSIVTVTVLIPVVNFVCNRFWVFFPGLVSLARSRRS